MADGGSNICHSCLHRYIRSFGYYGLWDLPVSSEVRLALRMASDHRFVCRRHRVISIPVLWSSNLRGERISSRLVDVPKVQCYLVVFYIRGHCNVLLGIGWTHLIQRCQDRVRETPRVKEPRSTNANAWDRKHPVHPLAWHSWIHIIEMSPR